MDELTGTPGLVALGGAALGFVAVVGCLVLAWRQRRLERAQRLVMGANGSRDLVAQAADLEREFGALSALMEDTATGLEHRVTAAEQRLDGAITHRALVRYDAYNELSGRQSMSIALLDAERSGIVVSAIHHRDQARLYAKVVREGRGELELSPEEAEAVEAALTGRRPATGQADAPPS